MSPLNEVRGFGSPKFDGLVELPSDLPEAFGPPLS